jgi:hypothetical protein
MSPTHDHSLLRRATDDEDLSPHTVRKVLASLEEAAQQRVKDGLNRFNFAFGVFNSHFIVYMFSVYPQHFWILYLVEVGFFLVYRLWKLSKKKPLNQVLHYLDFCWVTNMVTFSLFCIVLFLGGPTAEMFTDAFRQEFFYLAFGISCGPLMGALLVTPIPLVFHSNEIMSTLLIHFLPPMQMYILRWNSSVMREVWPFFYYPDFEFMNFWPKQSFTNNVFGNSIIFYFSWAVPYSIFQLLIGLDLPRTHRKSTFKNGAPKPPKYDTVYHFNMRNGQAIWQGKLFWKRSKEESQRMIDTNEFPLKDYFAYLLLHFIGVAASIIILAYACSFSKYVHGALMTALFIMVIWRGANRYVYYSTEMYAALVKKKYAGSLRDLEDLSPEQLNNDNLSLSSADHPEQNNLPEVDEEDPIETKNPGDC